MLVTDERKVPVRTPMAGQEEIWTAIDGNSLAFIGSELRVQRPGMAYMIRPDQSMTHSNINSGDTPVKFLWFSGNSLKR